jgi:hypothetical protein
MDDDYGDWIFDFDLSEKIAVINLVNSENIILNKSEDEKCVTGFSIKVKGHVRVTAEAKAMNEASNLTKILTIMSGVPLYANLVSHQGFRKNSKLIRIGRDFTFRYNIGGGIQVVDMTDKNTIRMIESVSSENFHLEDLYTATMLCHNHQPAECIKVLWKIIENRDDINGYHKYECLRHMYSHKPPYHSKTIELFMQEFGQDSFEYEKYDPANGFIVIDMKSRKNIQTLSKLARELMTQVKKIVGVK